MFARKHFDVLFFAEFPVSGRQDTKQEVSMADNKVYVPYIDRKGEKGTMQLPRPESISEAALSAILSWTYLGIDSYVVHDETDLTTPQAVTVNSLVENDKDMKCILGFEGAEGSFKISLPALKINVEGGIVIRWSQNKAYVPATKEVGEVGDSGAEIQAKVRTYTGDNTVKFVSGSLYKRP